MKFVMERDHNGVIRFRGEFDEMEMAELELSRFECMLLDDIGSDKQATAADYLLGLEMLYRRYAEQRHAPPTKGDNAAHLA